MELTIRRRRVITGGLLLGMSLGALEATVVGTAMPTVIAALGGLEHYAWVFSAYLLAATASVPIWGRASDLFGRRRMYLTGIVLFVAGSVLCGAAQSMFQLVAFRSLQGLGAGALVPLATTIIGEIYTIRERARVQALFSGMWGIASIAGPMVGGWLTDGFSWRWVFLINLPFGILGTAVMWVAYPHDGRRRSASVDWLGALLLFAGTSAVLAGLSARSVASLPWLGAALVLGLLFVRVERRAAEPVLPISLFANRILTRSLAIVFLVGVGMFGAIAFIPLFVQGVKGGTATEAGRVLTPLFLGWVTTSVVGARLALRVSYRVLTLTGTALVAGAFVVLSRVDVDTSLQLLYAVGFALGGGLGFSSLSLLLAVQHAVTREELGLATSLNQFARSVGSAMGVAVMGAVMTAMLGSELAGAATPSVNGVQVLRTNPVLAAHLAAALRSVFGVGAVAVALALVPAALLPRFDFSDVSPHAGERLLEAEMTTLEAEDEPSGSREAE